MTESIDYTQVTEVSGDEVSPEQIQRMFTRYSFAQQYCDNKDVLEVGCGAGQGLGLLKKVANTVTAGDYSEPLLTMVKQHYNNEIPLLRLDAQVLPFKSQSFDVIILYEAIYYLKKPQDFIEECSRALRTQGTMILCNANKNLPDFNPSPYSYHYYSPCDFADLLTPYGFQLECFGDCPVDYDSLKQRFLSSVKQIMVRFNLMPKTMSGKKLFKRIVFGKLMPLQAELNNEMDYCELPCGIDVNETESRHKVIFAVANRE